MAKLNPLRGLPGWRVKAIGDNPVTAAAHGRRRARALWDGYQVRPQCSGLQAGGEADRPA